MKIPVLLLGAGLLFWGWQINQLLVGIILAVLVEGARLVDMRWDFSDRDQRRAADLCMYLMVAVFLYAFIAGQGSNRFFLFISWLPVLVGPLFLVQIYGIRNGLNLAALSLVARKTQSRNRREGGNDDPPKLINISYIYLAVCLLAGGSTNNRTPWFYIILFLLVAWMVWSRRNTRYPAYILVGLLICGGVGGYAGQFWLQELQGFVEQKTLEWMGIDGHGERDPFQANTAIGSLGTLKLSDHIVARVFPEKGMAPPDLLRNGCYNVFLRSKWYVSSKEARSIPAGHDDATWDIRAGKAGQRLRKYRLATRLAAGEGLLAVPVGTIQLTDLPVEKVERGVFSAIRLSGAPHRLYPQVVVDPGADNDLPPVEADLLVSEHMQRVLRSIISRNDLLRANPLDTLRTVEGYFARNYTYTLVQEDPAASKNGLEFFLTKSHAGHCEYFASATVLLLRTMGLPARYVTGWAVSEYSELEQCYLVRSRHAHAWAMVYVDGHWRKIDTTPPDWLAAEAGQEPLLRPLSDFLSWCRYEITSWLDNKMPAIPAMAAWLVLPLCLLLSVRLLRVKRRARRGSDSAELQPLSRKQGFDSDFYRIEHFLTEQGMGRHASETLREWLDRVARDRMRGEQRQQLSHLLDLHYQYRFDPLCDTGLCRRELRELTRAWLTLTQKE